MSGTPKPLTNILLLQSCLLLVILDIAGYYTLNFILKLLWITLASIIKPQGLGKKSF